MANQINFYYYKPIYLKILVCVLILAGLIINIFSFKPLTMEFLAYFPFLINFLLLICLLTKIFIYFVNVKNKVFNKSNFLDICLLSLIQCLGLIAILYIFVLYPYLLFNGKGILIFNTGSIFLNVLVPFFCFLDLFLNNYLVSNNKNSIALSQILLGIYFISVVVLTGNNFKFSLVNVPFLQIKNVSNFCFALKMGYVGLFYWYLMALLLLLGISILMIVILNKIERKRMSNFVYY